MLRQPTPYGVYQIKSTAQTRPRKVARMHVTAVLPPSPEQLPRGDAGDTSVDDASLWDFINAITSVRVGRGVRLSPGQLAWGGVSALVATDGDVTRPNSIVYAVHHGPFCNPDSIEGYGAWKFQPASARQPATLRVTEMAFWPRSETREWYAGLMGAVFSPIIVDAISRHPELESPDARIDLATENPTMAGVVAAGHLRLAYDPDPAAKRLHGNLAEVRQSVNEYAQMLLIPQVVEEPAPSGQTA